ncbi:Alpha-D-ribose 1-methylphosphonate 5-triphosphate synthase subunit PhnH [compost metagenome]
MLIEVESLSAGAAAILGGPGIKDRQTLHAAGLPEDFWREWRLNHQRFPLGVDVFLTQERRICALPRSTRKEN